MAVVARVTLQQLAADLGVSRATVSNAYNRPDQLSKTLRERVLARAAELGFPGPDPVARGLRRGRVGAIGVLVDRSVSHAFSDPVAVLVLDGLAQELQAEGFGLLLHAADRHPASAQVVRAAAVDGWVVLSVPAGHPTVAAAQAQGRPLVVVDQPDLPGVPAVTIDDVGGARAAATHLLELGHRSIGVLTPPLDGGDAGGQVDVGRTTGAADEVMTRRLSGVFAALEEAGTSGSDVPVVECSENDEQAGAVGAALLLDDPARPTAVLALSDQLALGVLRCAAERGIGVPSRLSVVGFDDAPPGRTASPPLTTVAQPLHERGSAAGALLRDLLQGGAVRSPQPYPTRLVVRGTTARAPRTGVRPDSQSVSVVRRPGSR